MTCNGLVTAGAQRSPLGVVVRLAVGLTLVVEEGAALELLPAVLQENTETGISAPSHVVAPRPR